VAFAVLATAFVTVRPQIWWTDVRVAGVGALILAFGATVWIALPVVIAGLGLMHRFAGMSQETQLPRSDGDGSQRVSAASTGLGRPPADRESVRTFSRLPLASLG